MGSISTMILAVWRIFNIFLHNKYMGHQAKRIKEFEYKARNKYKNLGSFVTTEDGDGESQVEGIGKERTKWWQYISFSYLKQWCCMSKKFSQFYNRLATQISYVSLYEFCLIVERHQKELQNLLDAQEDSPRASTDATAAAVVAVGDVKIPEEGAKREQM